MQSTLRLASSNVFRGRNLSARQIGGLRKDLKQTATNPFIANSRIVVARENIYTDSKEGPLCQAESVKDQLKQVSNVDTPEKIRQAWFHPEFPVEKMTELLVRINLYIFFCVLLFLLKSLVTKWLII